MNSKKLTNNSTESKENKQNDLLKKYREQTVNEGQHDYHVDGYYGDYSDDCCC